VTNHRHGCPARRQRYAGYRLAEDLRYNERSGAERVNGRLKDDFGGRYVRVRGHAKVLCHLMFGILALTCDQPSLQRKRSGRDSIFALALAGGPRTVSS
jgi:hypothetical protein